MFFASPPNLMGDGWQNYYNSLLARKQAFNSCWLDTVIMKTIKERLIEEIKLSGLTTVEIGKRIGVSPVMITEYKTTKKMPSLQTFALLCKALDASADYILGLKD